MIHKSLSFVRPLAVWLMGTRTLRCGHRQLQYFRRLRSMMLPAVALRPWWSSVTQASSPAYRMLSTVHAPTVICARLVILL
jgi:hypothetical protein